jgi:hypothetical protein
MSPCTFYNYNRHKCVVAEQLKRCLEYTRRRQKYNVKGIPTSD